MASVCTATRTMPVAADITEHFERIETICQCIKRKTIFRLTQNTKQVKHLLIVGPSIVACHAANNCVIAARMHGCSCSRTAFSMLNRSASPHACAPRSFWAKDPHPTATKKLLINKSLSGLTVFLLTDSEKTAQPHGHFACGFTCSRRLV